MVNDLIEHSTSCDQNTSTHNESYAAPFIAVDEGVRRGFNTYSLNVDSTCVIQDEGQPDNHSYRAS
jgi:hypothetical protein